MALLALAFDYRLYKLIFCISVTDLYVYEFFLWKLSSMVCYPAFFFFFFFFFNGNEVLWYVTLLFFSKLD